MRILLVADGLPALAQPRPALGAVARNSSQSTTSGSPWGFRGPPPNPRGRHPVRKTRSERHSGRSCSLCKTTSPHLPTRRFGLLFTRHFHLTMLPKHAHQPQVPRCRPYRSSFCESGDEIAIAVKHIPLITAICTSLPGWTDDPLTTPFSCKAKSCAGHSSDNLHRLCSLRPSVLNWRNTGVVCSGPVGGLGPRLELRRRQRPIHKFPCSLHECYIGHGEWLQIELTASSNPQLRVGTICPKAECELLAATSLSKPKWLLCTHYWLKLL